jgi:hypothetical protein
MGRKLLMFAGLALSIVLPGTASAGLGWSGALTVTNIEIVNDGGFVVYPSGGLSAACTVGGVYIYANQNNVTADGVKALLAVVLTALTAGKTVQILYDDSTAQCYGRFIQINS